MLRIIVVNVEQSELPSVLQVRWKGAKFQIQKQTPILASLHGHDLVECRTKVLGLLAGALRVTGIRFRRVDEVEPHDELPASRLTAARAGYRLPSAWAT